MTSASHVGAPIGRISLLLAACATAALSQRGASGIAPFVSPTGNAFIAGPAKSEGLMMASTTIYSK